MHIIEQVRKNKPLIHHLTNQVVMNFTANGLLSFGGLPIMAKEKTEVNAIAQIADGILINIGTIIKPELESMILAGKTANQRGIPVVLDPVGVAASNFRNEVVETLLTEVQFTAIKGNAGEMAHLVNIPWETKGVESVDDDVHQLETIAHKVSKTYHTVAVVTGEIDVICDRNNIKTNDTGHFYLTKITGAGCLLGSIIAACLTTTSEKIDTIYEAIRFYGLSAERAAMKEQVSGPGTFLPHFIDELSGVQ